MADLLLGPIQRGLGAARRVWVEVDRPCTVEVLGREAPSFEVAGHHYAVVELGPLDPGTDVAYELHLDGERRWPEPGDPRPAPRVVHRPAGEPVALVVGSCREAGPNPRLGATGEVVGADALTTLATHLVRGTHAPVDGLVLLGDQIYADAPGTHAVEELRRRRGGPPRAGWPEVTGYDEYAWLYRHAWSDPDLRWLLATVPSVMVFDDHEVIDDWNTSAAWCDAIAGEPWWEGRITAAMASYWVYQHLGNVDSTAGPDGELLAEVLDAGADGAVPLRRLARHELDRSQPRHRWSHAHTVGGVRLVVVDTRDGRQLTEGNRSLLAPETWAWFDEQLTGGVEHLLVGSSLPWLLQRSIHEAEEWSERAVEGEWGGRVAAIGERLRRAVDLEHWPAFGTSFDDLGDRLAEVATGRRGPAPATIAVLSGDVHYGYLAEVDLGGARPVHQVVSSAFRQDLRPHLQTALRLSMSRPADWAAAVLHRTGLASRTRRRWHLTDGPWFDDHLAVLELHGAHAHITYEGADLTVDPPVLRTLLDRPL